MKDIIETDECMEFFAILNAEEAEDYILKGSMDYENENDT